MYYKVMLENCKCWINRKTGIGNPNVELETERAASGRIRRKSFAIDSSAPGATLVAERRL